MPTKFAQECFLKFCDWIGRAATAFHLWCAEYELRLMDTQDLSPVLRDARTRNLDLLREYRRRGEFPRNRHAPNRYAPCFIDSAGRQCAVACLMHASADDVPALKVAESANFARIRDMNLPELNTWASESGFKKAELARIQPGYAPTPEQLQYAFDFLFAIWLIGSLAIMSILVNSLRLVIAFGHRFNTSLIGIMSGVLLLGLCLQLNLSQFSHTRLIDEVAIYQIVTIGIGILAVALAVIPVFWRRAERESTTPIKPSVIKRSVLEFLTMMILAILFLTIPVLAYLKVIGPASDSRFQLVREYGHQHVVMGVALSSDGKVVVTASDDGTAILWEAASGKRVKTFHHGHTGGITCVAMSGDGKKIVTGSMDKTAVLWDAASDKKILTLRGHTWWIDSVAITKDGKQVLTGSWDRTAILWDATSGKKLQTFNGHTGGISSVALSSDGKHVVTGTGDGSAILWEAASGEKLQTFSRHTDQIVGVALSADGKHLVTGSWDKTAILWELASGKNLKTFRGHTHRIMSVAVSSDARLIVTGSTDNTAALWDAATGKQIETFRGHLHPVTSVALSGDGKQVVTGSGDHKAILWDAGNGKKLQIFGNWP